jgi:hypothetical protein
MGGFIIFTPVFIYKIIATIIMYGDNLADEFIFRPFGVKIFPIAGFASIVAFIYLIGWTRETKIGTWIYEKMLECVPLAGKIFTTPSKSSQEVLSRINGFVFAPIWNGYRPARFSAIFPLRYGGWWVQLSFLFFPLPTTQSYPSEVIIYAIECAGEKGKHYRAIPEEHENKFKKGYEVFSTEIGFRVEFTAGTTIPEKSFFNLVPVTLAEFLQSQGF